MSGDPILFWTQVAAIGQVAGALATAAAVIVTLWIVLSERGVKVRVGAGLRLIIAGDGSPATDAIIIRITNTGMRNARVNSISWRTGWLKFGPAWLRRQFAMLNPTIQDRATFPPFDLAPGEERTVEVSTDVYAQSDKLRLEFFNRQFPWRRTPSPTRVDVLVHLVAANDARERVEKDLATFLTSGKIEGGAASFNEKTRGPK